MAKLTSTREFKELVELGTERGYLSYGEIINKLPQSALEMEKLDKMCRD